MLGACKAIAIGRTEEQVEFLTVLARRCGFALIEGAAGGDIPAQRTLISFFLVHYQVGEELLDRVIRSVRAGDLQVRFFPIVVIADDCPFEQVLRYVHLGVDDVISLPEKREVLIQRLTGQLWAEVIYIETPEYFGPDRRRLEVEQSTRMGQAGYASFHIQRLPDVGIRIVRHHIFAAVPFSRLHLAGAERSMA